jgi:hypothetical protein
MAVVGVLGLVEVEFVAAGVVVAGHNTMFLKKYNYLMFLSILKTLSLPGEQVTDIVASFL